MEGRRAASSCSSAKRPQWTRGALQSSEPAWAFEPGIDEPLASDSRAALQAAQPTPCQAPLSSKASINHDSAAFFWDSGGIRVWSIDNSGDSMGMRLCHLLLRRIHLQRPQLSSGCLQ